MTDTTPADQLRQAASLLRDKATNAIHEGRTTWSTGRTLGSRSPVVVDDQEQPSVLIETYAARLERVNSYLALLGPATGLAVADWLDSAAEDAEQIGADHHALVVARQVLGTTGQPETGRSCRRSDCLAPGHRFMLGSTVYTCTGEPTALPAPVDRAAILREAADAVLDIIGADARLPQTISGVYRAADHLRRLAGEAQQPTPAPAPAEAHICDNCDGIDPDTCWNNSHRPPEQCPAAQFEDYGQQCQKHVGHELHSFEEQPTPAPAEERWQPAPIPCTTPCIACMTDESHDPAPAEEPTR